MLRDYPDALHGFRPGLVIQLSLHTKSY